MEDYGYAFEVARDGKEAVEKSQTGVYAVILMDVQMPGMNGFDATQIIRDSERVHNKPRTPIIGMTAHALAGDRERCLSIGMDDYIAKPVNKDELRGKLELYISKP